MKAEVDATQMSRRRMVEFLRLLFLVKKKTLTSIDFSTNYVDAPHLAKVS